MPEVVDLFRASIADLLLDLRLLVDGNIDAVPTDSIFLEES
jgi:hypothetical protein